MNFWKVFFLFSFMQEVSIICKKGQILLTICAGCLRCKHRRETLTSLGWWAGWRASSWCSPWPADRLHCGSGWGWTPPWTPWSRVRPWRSTTTDRWAPCSTSSKSEWWIACRPTALAASALGIRRWSPVASPWGRTSTWAVSNFAACWTSVSSCRRYQRCLQLAYKTRKNPNN